MPALQAALALAQVDDVAVLVGEDLDLDVPRPLHVPLQQQGVVAERGPCLPARRGDRRGQLRRRGHQPHALAAASGGRLDQQRVADLIRGVGQVRVGRRLPGLLAVTGQHRHSGGQDRGLGPDLVAHRLDRGGGRADEGQAGRGAGASEGGVLRQEPVARVHRLRARPRARRRAPARC